LKPRRPQGRYLLGAPTSFRPVAQLAEHSAVTGAVACSTHAWPANFSPSQRWPRGSRRRFAKPQGRKCPTWVRIPLSPPDAHAWLSGRAPLLQSGSPWFDPKCVHHSCDVSSVGTERRFAMPEVEGSTPSRRATYRWRRPCGVSSADQSSWFRPRRSRVQVLHAAPISSAGSHSGLVALPRKQRVGHRHEGSNPSPAANFKLSALIV
jgi:hypothetical protein